MTGKPYAMAGMILVFIMCLFWVGVAKDLPSWVVLSIARFLTLLCWKLQSSVMVMSTPRYVKGRFGGWYVAVSPWGVRGIWFHSWALRVSVILFFPVWELMMLLYRAPVTRVLDVLMGRWAHVQYWESLEAWVLRLLMLLVSMARSSA